MLYFTYKEFVSKINSTQINCDGDVTKAILNITDENEPIAYAEMIYRLLNSTDITEEEKALYFWKNHKFWCEPNVFNVGQECFNFWQAYFGIENTSNMHRVKNVKDCNNVAYSNNLENCFYSVKCNNSKNLLFCSFVTDNQSGYKVFNKEVTEERFVELLDKVNNYIRVNKTITYDYIRKIQEFDEGVFLNIRKYLLQDTKLEN